MSTTAPSVNLTAGGDLLIGGDLNLDIIANSISHVSYNIGGSIGSLDVSYENIDLSDLEAILDETVDSVTEAVIEDVTESKKPVDNLTASLGSLPKSRGDVYMPECSGNNKNCKKKIAVRKFLSSLLIGSGLPE